MIRIAYPDIGFDAISVDTTQAYKDFFPVYNLFAGTRYAHAELQTSTSSNRDVVITGKQASSASYLIIARADRLIAQGITSITLSRSSDNITFTDVETFNPSGQLTGNKNQDIIRTFTQTSAFQFWRLRLSGSSAVTRFSKAYFGNMFVFDREPESYEISTIEAVNRDFVASSGAVFPQKSGNSKLRFNISWNGLSEDNKNDFEKLVGIKKDKAGMFLHADNTASQKILNNNSLVHVTLVDYRIENLENYPDWNRLTCDFVEQIG
jgi:hypothetical protein